MKQLLIVSNSTYGTLANGYDLTKLAKGQIEFFEVDSAAKIAARATENFMIALGRGANLTPFIIPEVDVRSLSVTKATASAATTFSANLTIPTPKAGKDYTIIFVKKGTGFNERSNWTVTHKATDKDTAATIATTLAKFVNDNTAGIGLSATVSSAKITVTANESGKDFAVVPADEIMGLTVTTTATGYPAVVDAEYIRDLAQRCVAGKGVNYLAGGDEDIYPGYPESVADGDYILYTLRFAVPRVAAKQRDEVVYQIVHIAIPATATGVASTIEAIVGLTDASDASATSLDDED